MDAIVQKYGVLKGPSTTLCYVVTKLLNNINYYMRNFLLPTSISHNRGNKIHVLCNIYIRIIKKLLHWFWTILIKKVVNKIAMKNKMIYTITKVEAIRLSFFSSLMTWNAQKRELQIFLTQCAKSASRRQ